jgi:hypothetical protein
LQAVLWGLIDAARVGIASTKEHPWRRQDAATVDAQAQQDARKLKRLLWINTGLDVLYVAGGLGWALTRGAESAFAAGTGWGIVLQGSFLFLFDLFHARGASMNLPGST